MVWGEIYSISDIEWHQFDCIHFFFLSIHTECICKLVNVQNEFEVSTHRKCASKITDIYVVNYYNIILWEMFANIVHKRDKHLIEANKQ